MKRLSVIAVMAAVSVACGGGSSTTSDTPPGADGAAAVAESAAKAAPVPVVREFTVPDGTSLRLDLVTPLDSDASRVEDTVRATLREAVTVDGTTVLPVGTELTGTVTEAEGSGRVKGRARLGFRFTGLRTGAERHEIQTAPISLEAEPTKGEDAKKIGIGAGIGAAVGAIAGGASGAAKGAAIGAGGANVTARLTAPLKVQLRS
jgi:hypothetical protein